MDKHTFKPKKQNTFLLLDMHFDELVGVEQDYEDPSSVNVIHWITSHASYAHIDNNNSDAGGVYDFIFNLSMLESYIDAPIDSSLRAELTPLFEQLLAIHSAGYNYILFNQGC